MYARLASNTITKTRYDIELPDIKLIPEGVENICHTVVTSPDGVEENVCVWAEPAKEKTIELMYKNVHYTANVEDTIPQKLVVTVEDEKITKINAGIIKQTLEIQPDNCEYL